MARSLGDIPGSNRPRKRFASSRDRELWGPSRSFNLDLTPRGLPPGRTRARRPRMPARLDASVLLIAVAALGVVLWLGTSFWKSTRVEVEVSGLVSGASFTPDDGLLLDVVIRVPSEGDRFRAALTVDGVDVLDDVGFLGDTLHLRPSELVKEKLVESALDEGEHTITLSVGRLFLSDAEFRWRYKVDSVAPLLGVPPTLDPAPIDKPVTVTGTLERDAQLTVNNKPVTARDGSFAVTFDHPPTGVLHFLATDPAGNTTLAETVVTVRYPAASRGIHVTAAAWNDAELRGAILDLIDRDLIDTVQLDLKDERGVVNYASKVPVASRIGAVEPGLDLPKVLRSLDKRDVRVIGRVVAFRDPKYADAAWAAGRKDEVLQTPAGEPLPSYGGFTNYVHPAVQKYNLDIAKEAADLGVRDILWDYVRRPEGNPSAMVIPGLDGPSSEVIADFLATAHRALRAKGVYQGASVLGISAAAGDSVAQDVPRMARAVDYLAPTVFPSSWGPGQYRVTRPVEAPAEITSRALTHFVQVTAGSGVRFLPWIQDYSTGGVTFGPVEVRAQVDAAAALGLDGFLLWNPGSRYTADALVPIG